MTLFDTYRSPYMAQNTRFTLRLSHAGIILVVVPLVMQLLFLWTLAKQLQEADQEIKRANTSRTIVAEANALSGLLDDVRGALLRYNKSKTKELSNIYDAMV